MTGDRIKHVTSTTQSPKNPWHKRNPSLRRTAGERAEGFYRTAAVLADAGDYSAATHLLLDAIRTGGAHSRYSDALASVLRRGGGAVDTIAVCFEAVNHGAGNSQIHRILGRALMNTGNAPEAARWLERASQDPRASAASLLDLGNALHRSGQLEPAADAYETYVARNAGDKHGHFNLAVTLMALNRLDGAIVSCEKAIGIDPSFAEALNNAGIIHQCFGRMQEARHFFQRALAAKRDYADAAYNLATVESDLGNYPEAVSGFAAILKRNPANPDGWNNLGNALLALGHPAEALEAFQLAVRLRPTFPVARWNAGLAQLTMGQFGAGWQGFEHRDSPRWDGPPRWDGSGPQGKSLLIRAEQGFGDTIHFVRYASLVASAGGSTILECHPELVELLRGARDVDCVLARGAELPVADYQVPLLSLPFQFGTDADTIPGASPYIFPHPRLVEEWGVRLGLKPDHINVGLVWAGSPGHRNDRHRSIDPRLFAQLEAPANVSLFCLQQKPQSSGVTLMKPLTFSGVYDELRFPQTAAILSHLDLLISVDTAAAHLAGAMAKNVWMLLPYAADWRWLQHRDDSPWYPTMRIFRQPRLHDWPAVIASVSSALASLAERSPDRS